MKTFNSTRRRLLGATAAGFAAVGSGCSGLGLINAFVPTDTHTRTSEISYGDHERTRLDVYAPAHNTGAAPLVVFFYGGNWNSGDRGNYRFVGEALASQGLVAVIPDYRLYPEVRFPDFLVDCAAAVRWASDHATTYGADPRNVFLMGHSAGAYNAAMLALNAEYLDNARVDRSRIRGWVGLAGPYDFLPLTGEITRAVFGYPDTSIRTQPIHFVSRGDPAALLITGSTDGTVNPGNSARLAARLRQNQVDVREVTYPDVSHTRLVAALATPFRNTAPVLADVAGFIRA